MSQRKRIVLVAVVLVVALTMVPVPSRAAVVREGCLPVLDLWERAWAWLAHLVEPRTRWEKEGGAIDPDGKPKPGTATLAPDTATAEEGGAIDPDGAR